MKTLSKIQEEVFGNITDVIGPSDLANIRKFAQQFSSAYQPSMEDILYNVELTLNKFGYAVAISNYESFNDQDLEDSGKARLAICNFATRKVVKNAYLILTWERLASGQQFFYTKTGAVNNYSANLTLQETLPEEHDTVFSTQIADSEDGQPEA